MSSSEGRGPAPIGFGAEALAGGRAARVLFRVWTHTRTGRERRVARLGGWVFAALMLVSMGAGPVLRRQDPGGRIANLLDSFAHGDVGSIGRAALAVVLVGMLFAPVTGAATQGTFSDTDLAGVLPPRLHRWYGGLVSLVLSPVGASQLVTLTLLTSMIVPDRGIPSATLVSATLWALAVLWMSCAGWGVELVRRRVSAHVRWYLAALLGVALLAAVVLDPERARSLYGASTAYPSLVLAAGERPPVVLATLAAAAAAGLALAVLGLWLARQALVLPAAVERQRQRTGSVRLPSAPTWSLMTVLALSLWRTREVRRPLLTMLVVAVPLILAGTQYVQSGNDASTSQAVTVVLPLAVAMGWGVNAFGVLAGGVTLLLSQPGVVGRMVSTLAALQAGMTLGLGLPVLLVARALGQMSTTELVAQSVGLAVATVVVVGMSLRWTVLRPRRTRLTGRGEPLVPPMVGLGYIVSLMLAGSIVGTLTTRSLGDMAGTRLVIWSLVLVALVVVYWRVALRRVQRVWADPHRRAAIAALVGAE